MVLKATDETAAGSTDTYLKSPLRFTQDEHGQAICLLQVNEDEEIGVMMGWEHGISKYAAQLFSVVMSKRDSLKCRRQ